MVRRAVEVRREQILGETVAQVHVRGFDGVRVQDVASGLGISQALVFYHFETKDRLLSAALELAVQRDVERLHRTLQRGTDPTDRLRRLLKLYAPQGTARGWTIWVDAWSGALRAPELRATVRRLDEVWREALVAVLEDGVQTAEFDCPDPAGSAQRLMSLMDGLAIQVTVHRALSARRMSEWARRTAESELGLADRVLDP